MATFKTRARTLDMLGRQQIAGIPTAISELFKNAHDAYADNVDVDYYRSDGLFVLRDDGLGMTKQDFIDRWLTLGTESKLENNSDSRRRLALPPNDPTKPERPILGEKGIGRLAIASIGPQVLVLSRAKRQSGLQDLVVAFINWEIFELPGIDLNEVEIPIRTYATGQLPNKNDISEMVNEVKQNIDLLKDTGKIDVQTSDKITNHLKEFVVDPVEIDGYLGKPSLSDAGYGTHFIILPAYDIIQSAIDGDPNSDKASPLLKSLIGFTNTMVENKNNVIKASFRDHKTDDYYDDLISDPVFFTPDEFKIADHHFQGQFNEFGQFAGTVTVYGEKTVDHDIYWDNGNQKTRCGPFSINVAYVQGKKDQTKLPPEEHAIIMSKLSKLGGLYIYRDNIRILPYGNTDYDFLDIERNRTLSASYYYFSYRRMIGYIDISRKNNPELIEKAGREGFIENKAYRQFRTILKNFFQQLAADFFRENSGGPKTDFFLNRREELQKSYQAKLEAEKKASIKKATFQKDLDNFFTSIKNENISKEIENLLAITERELNIAIEKNDLTEANKSLLDIESQTERELNVIRNKYKVIKPRGFAIGKQLQTDWEAYLTETDRLEKELFQPASVKLNNLINNAAREHNIIIDNRRRFQRSLNDIIENAKTITKSETSETEKTLGHVETEVITLTKNILVEMEDEASKAMTEFAKLDISNQDESQLLSIRNELEKPIIEKANKNKEILDSIQEQLKNIVTRDQSGNAVPSSIDITEAYDEEIAALKERAEMDLELSQLGMAVGVIHHEFTGTVNSIRKNIKSLKKWADTNNNLYTVYENIRANFEHLDGYLTLFTPLNRRLYRKEVEINGYTIKQFLEDLFSERMRRHDITFISTDEFDKKVIIGFPSTFYPVFVNVIDNAIFWLKDRPLPRKILLDADLNGYYISNNGPEILPRDYQQIFNQGFSRKPNGRGLGLYISREVLKRVGYSIFVTDAKPEMSVTFRIEPTENKDNTQGEVNDG